MDVIERLNKRFGSWYEGLLGGGDKANEPLRPRDVLRRIVGAMEDARREGLDGQVYVPNAYTLQIAPQNDEERDYLRAFLNADELAVAVQNAADRHNYKTRGPLTFTVEEVAAPAVAGESRVKIVCRFDVSATPPVQSPPSPPSAVVEAAPVLAPLPPNNGGVRSGPSEQAPVNVKAPIQNPPLLDDRRLRGGTGAIPEDDEPGTVPVVRTQTLGSLTVRGGNGQLVDVFPLGPNGATMGRGKQAGNSIVLASDTMISKRHARIDLQSDRFVLRDENSTNGTFVVSEGVSGEVPVVSGGPGRVLRDGDQIRLGETTLLFRASDSANANAANTPSYSAPVSQPAYFAPQLPVSAQAPSGGPLVLIAGDGETFPLASEMTVGRSLTGDIVLIGNGVAYQHARLTNEGDTVAVEDLGAPGGTFVNGEKIPARFPVVLRVGDQIAFGEVLLHLEQKGRGF